MKSFFYLLILCISVSSCKKGKKLPQEVPVQFIPLTESVVYPESAFPPFNPNDPYEQLVYPRYAHEYSASETAANFNNGLVSYLNKNRVILQSDTAEYVLKITSLYMKESIERQSYTDSCSFNYPIAYVYKSSLRFSVSASLYKNGVFVNKWTEEGNSWERFKSKKDNCNKPEVSSLLRGPYSLINQVAKELRVRISKELYLLET